MENQSEVGQVSQVNQKPNNFLVILLSILLLVSCVIAGFFAYQTQNLTMEIKKIRSQTIPSPTIFSTAQPKADWKIDNNRFTSNSLGFEITFPKSWKLDFSLADWGKDLYILTALNEANHYSVLIFIAPKNGETLPGPTGFGAGEWRENGSINILGQKLIKKALIYENKTENIMYSSIDDRVIDFPNSNMLFNFIVQSNIDSNYNITSQFQKEVDQILPTFKFIDNTKEEICIKEKYTWLSKYNECEGTTLTEAFCKKEGGTFNGCESACRHEDPNGICTTECIAVCKF